MTKNIFKLMVTTGCLLVIAATVWLATAQPVSAQCGSQASTCKDCHEIQGQMSVNTDGTGWHQSHAFGDFCYICHAGNQQAAEKEAAHTGMVSPFADTKASCQQCHPKDLDERATVYMDILGLTAESESAAPAAVQQVVVNVCEPKNDVPADKTIVLSKPSETVDYEARYNENVLGIRTINWGLIGLAALSTVVIIGGAGFGAVKKGWLVVTFEKPVREDAQDEVEEGPKE